MAEIISSILCSFNAKIVQILCYMEIIFNNWLLIRHYFFSVLENFSKAITSKTVYRTYNMKKERIKGTASSLCVKT